MECFHMGVPHPTPVQNESFFKCFNILRVGGSETYFCLPEEAVCLKKNQQVRWLIGSRALGHSENTRVLGVSLLLP